MLKNKTWTYWALGGVVLLAMWLMFGGTAKASDLGGNCCADLEERIAELEQTTVGKGNARTQVRIVGRVSRALVYTDFGDYNDWSVGDNSNDPSYVGIAGTYVIAPKLKAKSYVEIGLGGYEANMVTGGYGHIESDTTALYMRQVWFRFEHEDLGAVTVGKAKQATDGISQLDRTRSFVASQPMTLRPLTGPGFGEAIEMDGTRANVVRYDSPSLKGFWLSGSVAASNTDLAGETDGNVWDVAARYWGTLGQFDIAAGVGYREGIWIEDDSFVGVPLSISIDGLPKVLSGSASVKHKPSGIFVNASYGNMDLDVVPVEISSYAVKAGVEVPWLKPFGKGFGAHANSTTAYVEYGNWDLGDLGVSDVDYWGAGLVQTFGPVDLYVSGRRYDVFDEDLTVVMAGGSLSF
jgi:hypothetical protein